MPVVSKRITIDNVTFSLNALIVNPNKYLPLMQIQLRANVFAKRANEDNERYLTRIFNAIYRSTAGTVTTPSGTRRTCTPIPLTTGCEKILNALGIELVKRCPKRSSIMFKHSGNKYRMNNDEMNKLLESIKKKTSFRRKYHPKFLIGVELEFIGNRNKVEAFNTAMYNLVGGDRYNPEMSYNKNRGSKWVLGTDGSVHAGGSLSSAYRGFELTSPILNPNSKKDMLELKKVTVLIKDIMGGTVNATCGTHIHMSFPVESVITDELIMHFARSYRKSENTLFDKVVPLRRRGNRAHYSKTVSVVYLWDRYRKLNFNNVEKNTKNMHLEFRQLDGTLDYDKIYAWCKLQQLFVEMTLDTYDKKCEDTMKPIEIELNDVIIKKAVTEDCIESLMKMSKMVA